MKIALIVCVIALCSASVLAEDIFATVSNTGMKLLSESVVEGVTIRQCSCEEQQHCLSVAKEELTTCTDECWFHMGKLTPHPEQFRKCFVDETPFVDSFLGCIGSNIDSCYPTKDGPQIAKQDFNKLFSLGESKLNASKSKILQNSAIQSIRGIVESALKFGTCVKECMVEHREHDKCFEEFDCQPSLQEKKAKKSLKKCVRSADLKSKAGELCQCSLDAGVSELSDFCPLIKLIGVKKHSHPKSTYKRHHIKDISNVTSSNSTSTNSTSS